MPLARQEELSKAEVHVGFTHVSEDPVSRER